ncbi:MAG: glycine cleavage system aminomethyltransferase GcvT [Armatimonadetes bacterium]|nr:glycine cleavage system aminomethyltransferase GcvT [Armatimonadota bacterium]
MELRRTPLYDRHVALGARMVPFGGWEMPVQYEGILAEHRAARAGAGAFDVCHMGELELRGPGALPFLQQALTNDFSSLAAGRCRYSLMCAPDGGILDDLVVYRTGEESWMVVVNAANTPADVAWLTGLPRDGCSLDDRSAATALIAVQGPGSPTLLRGLLRADHAARLAALRYYAFGTFELFGVPMLISRTGYTGDAGFELCFAREAAGPVWDQLLAAGAVPVGLGARDTLRLEAGFCLHGHDISPQRNPIEADLPRFVSLAKGDFVGREALARAAEAGPAEKLVGLEVVGRGVVREGYPILHGEARVGTVTSGSYGPSVDRFIAMGYVRADLAEVGTELAVEVRDKPVPCRVAARPFYRPG